MQLFLVKLILYSPLSKEDFFHLAYKCLNCPCLKCIEIKNNCYANSITSEYLYNIFQAVLLFEFEKMNKSLAKT